MKVPTGASPKAPGRKKASANLPTAPAKKTKSKMASEFPQPRDTATIQQHTRRAHAQERAQDYVETIAELIATKGEARLVDMAKKLGVSHVTVARTLQRLQREELVTTEPYRSVFLTDKGRSLAKMAKARHETVVSFLIGLGVSPEIAHRDAEGIEHHVSRETLTAMQAFLGKAH